LIFFDVVAHVRARSNKRRDSGVSRNVARTLRKALQEELGDTSLESVVKDFVRLCETLKTAPIRWPIDPPSTWAGPRGSRANALQAAVHGSRFMRDR